MIRVKGVVVFFLILALSLSIFVTTVFAAEDYTIGLQDANQNAKITAKAGDKVEAYLYLSGNPGILTAGVLIECPKGISITNAQSALAGPNFTPVWQLSKNYTVNPYLVWMLAPTGTNKNALVTYNGNWCKLTFRLDAELAPGDHTIRLSAPKDKNLTAQTSGGVIKPNTNTYVSGVSVANLTISVKESVCDHNWSKWSTITPTSCDKAGKQMRECSLCHTEQEKTIDATGHSFGKWTETIKPTCTKAGSEKRTCQNGCGHTENRSVAKLAHQFGQMTVKKEPTCEKDGLKSGVCTLCKEKRTETIARLQHKFSKPKVVKAATCTQDGQKAGKCENCGKDAKETIPATGHDFGQMKIVRQPTAQKPGLKQSKCSRCGEVKEEEIPVVPEETTAETTEATTEATTLPEVTTGEETLPGENVPEETLPVSATPEETQPGYDSPTETILKTVVVVAGILLLGVLTLVVVIAIRDKKK